VLRAFRQTLGAIESAGIAVVGPDGTQVYVNPAFCRLLGWPEEELIGAKPPFVYWPDEERERIQAGLDASMRGEAPPGGFEVRLRRQTGDRFDACVAITPLKDHDGAPAGWLASVTEISERKRHERRRATEHEVVSILGSASSLAEAAPRIIHAVCANLGWDVGALWRVDHSGELTPLTEAWATPQFGAGQMTSAGTIAAGTGLPGRVCATGEPAWIADVGRDPVFLRTSVAQSERLRSAFVFPIIAASRVLGVMEFFSREPQQPDDDLLRTATALGHQIGQFIEREEAEAAQRQSEERYRAIVEMANEGVWVVDTQTRTLYANRRIAEMLGVTADELAARTALDFCFPEDISEARKRIGANLDGRSEQFDFRFRRKDGSELVALACTSPLRDACGRIVGALGMFSDVTDRRRAEEAMQQLAAIVESSDDAIIGKTLDGVILSWNSAAERIYGYTAAEAIGRSMTMLLPPDRPDEEQIILERLQRGGRVDHFETVRLRSDGRAIDVSMTVSPIRDKTGRIIGASSVIRDITERRRFEEQIRETQKLESLGVLAGGVAHDFNNLLVGIMGNASLALDTLAPQDPARRMIDGVLQASERAASLTRQLLAYSGKGRFVVQPIELSVLIREIVALIHTSIPKSVRVHFDLDDALPTIDADIAQIQQLVMNLVINGAEAIGDVPGTVTIRTRLRQIEDARPLVSLEVEDTGCGMDPATKERIFEPFFTTKFTGRGLGLAAVLGIVRGHGGVIEVETTPGQGSRFTVCFPAADVRTAHAGAREVPDFRGNGAVLIVDDEDIVRETARAALERYGYKVLVAADGPEALECLQNEPEIKLVLLDLTMPVMSGEEALHEIHRLRPGLPVILSSGYNEIEAIRRFQGQNLSGFLQKPFTCERLAEKVKAATRSAHG
jgi:PAS domain S-box-containing protein